MVPSTSLTGLGHLNGRRGITNKSGSVFCSVSTLTSGNSLEVSLRNAPTKVGSRLQESGNSLPLKAVRKLTLRSSFFSKHLFAHRSFLDLATYMCLKGTRIWHRLWARIDTEASEHSIDRRASLHKWHHRLHQGHAWLPNACKGFTQLWPRRWGGLWRHPCKGVGKPWVGSVIRGIVHTDILSRGLSDPIWGTPMEFFAYEERPCLLWLGLCRDWSKYGSSEVGLEKPGRNLGGCQGGGCMAKVVGLKVSHADCPWWGQSMSCSPLWTMFLTHLTMSLMSKALDSVEVCVVQHQNFCAAGKGRSPSWQFTLELTSLAPRNGKTASCPLVVLKGFWAWGCGGPWDTSDPRSPWGRPVGVGSSTIWRHCKDWREEQRPGGQLCKSSHSLTLLPPQKTVSRPTQAACHHVLKRILEILLPILLFS